jgi:hypothetical protein
VPIITRIPVKRRFFPVSMALLLYTLASQWPDDPDQMAGIIH